MVLLNTTNLIGELIVQASYNITGSIFITLLLIFFLAVLILLIFRADINIIAIVCFPLLIVFSAYDNAFFMVSGIILLIMAVIFSLNFILNR